MMLTEETSSARFAEQLLRSGRQRALRRADAAMQEPGDVDSPIGVQGQLAEEFYRRAATVDFVRFESADVVRTAWRGLQEWYQEEPFRFEAHREAFIDAVIQVHGGTAAGVGRTLDELVEESADVGEVPVPEASADRGYDSPAARARRNREIDESSLHLAVKAALKLADLQNGRDPAAASAAARAQRDLRVDHSDGTAHPAW